MFKLLFVLLFSYFRFYVTLWYLFVGFVYYLDFIFLYELAFYLVFIFLYFNFFVLFYNGELFYLNAFNFIVIFFGLFFTLFITIFINPFYVCSFLYIGSGLILLIRFVLCSLEILSLYCRFLSLFLRLMCNLLSLHLLNHLLLDFF